MNETSTFRPSIGDGLLNQKWSNYGFDFGPLEHKNDSDAPSPLSHNISSASSTTEEQTSTEEEYVPGNFEGPEKTMEVVFKPMIGAAGGLRGLDRTQLDELCMRAKCSILSKTSNNYMDAYVLSESSLFVYEHRLIMKTCGTTTLLRCLGTLFRFADALGLELAFLGYSRKNFLFPSAQMWPHANFGDEMRYISSHKELDQRLAGAGYILGPVTGDHWFVYVAENTAPSITLALHTAPAHNFNARSDVVDNLNRRHLKQLQHPHHHAHYRTLNMMMFDMDPSVASIFMQSENALSGKEMTAKAGIQALCPGATIDEHAFSPCGYSMNAILHDAYSTIHITPESECSYVSFETNTRLQTYCPLVRHVLSVFRPKRFVLTLFGDEPFLATQRALPTDRSCINLPLLGCYKRTSCSNTKVEQQNQCCVMACYSFQSHEQHSAASTTTAPRVAAASDAVNCGPEAYPPGPVAPLACDKDRDRGSQLVHCFQTEHQQLAQTVRKERAYSLC